MRDKKENCVVSTNQMRTCVVHTEDVSVEAPFGDDDDNNKLYLKSTFHTRNAAKSASSDSQKRH